MSEQLSRKRSNKKPMKNQKKINSKKKKQKGSWLWKTWVVLFSLIFVGTAAVGGLALFVYFDVSKDLPSIDLAEIVTQEASVVFGHDGNKVSTLAEDGLITVEADQVPQSLRDAFTAVEDARFLRHKGIDGPRTMQALLGNIVSGGITSGGSTVTQQLVQNTVLRAKMADNVDGYRNSKKRKIEEWIIAYKLEKQLSKDEIMVSYLNNAVSFGQWVGVGTASKRFFNKNVSELTLPEAALLAGIPQLPGENNPFVDIESATERYKEVLYLMNRHGFITKEEEEAMGKIPLADLVIRNQHEILNPHSAYFSAVESELYDIFGIEPDDDTFPDFYRNFEIHTAYNVEQQALMNEIMNTNEYVDWETATANVYGWNAELDDFDRNNYQGAMTVVNNKNGEIPSIAASRNFSNTGINIAVDGYRSPGSSIKPVIDYAPYVEKFQVGATHIMNDGPTFYTGGSGEVNNFSGGHEGFVTMEYAVAHSQNTTAVKAIQAVGVEYAAEMAGKMGITKAVPLLEEGMLGESAALGGGIETTTKEMAGAYATIANGGTHFVPHTVKKVVNMKTGKVVFDYEQDRKPEMAMSESTAATIVQTLLFSEASGTPNGGGRVHTYGNIPVGAKTGTSSYSTEELNEFGMSRAAEKDHWHVAITPDYSIAAWTGLSVENADVLTKTLGNVNANKHWGSHMIKPWFDAFAPEGTSYEFLGSANSGTSSSIGGFDVSVSIDSETGNGAASWTKPGLNMPAGLTDDDKASIGNIVYDVSVAGPNGVCASAGQLTDTSYSFGGCLVDAGTYTVTVTANVANEKARQIFPAVSASGSAKYTVKKIEETTKPVDPEEESETNIIVGRIISNPLSWLYRFD